MKKKNLIAGLMAAAMLFAAGGSTYAVDLNCGLSVSSSSDKEEEDDLYTVEEGETRIYFIKLSGVKKPAAATTDSSILKITKVSYKKGKFTVTVKGMSDGNAAIKVYDKKNKSNKSILKLTVKGLPKDEKDKMDNYAETVLEIVNKEREKEDLEPLELDDKLCEAADIRAKETAKLFSHDRPDGTSCFTVLDDVGASYTAAGENIAQGQRSCEEVMEDWMNSPHHKENIMSTKFTRLGVGYDENSDSWVQIFTN